MHKKILLFCTSFLLSSLFLPTTESTAFAEEAASAESTAITMTIGTVEAEAGTTVEVPVSIENSINGIMGLNVAITCDLPLTPVMEAGIGGSLGQNPNKKNVQSSFFSNQVTVTWENKEPRTGVLIPFTDNSAEDFFTVSFQIPETAQDGTEYVVFFKDNEITVIDSAQQSVKISGNNGKVIVISSTERTERSTSAGRGENNSETQRRTPGEAKSEEQNSSGIGIALILIIFLLGTWSSFSLGYMPKMVIQNKKMKENLEIMEGNINAAKINLDAYQKELRSKYVENKKLKTKIEDVQKEIEKINEFLSVAVFLKNKSFYSMDELDEKLQTLKQAMQQKPEQLFYRYEQGRFTPCEPAAPMSYLAEVSKNKLMLYPNITRTFYQQQIEECIICNENAFRNDGCVREDAFYGPVTADLEGRMLSKGCILRDTRTMG